MGEGLVNGLSCFVVLLGLFWYLGLDFIMSDTLGKLSVKDGSEFL